MRLRSQGRPALDRDSDVTLGARVATKRETRFANAGSERYALCLMLGLPLSVSRSLSRIFGLGTLVSLALAACADHRPLGQLRDGDAACQDMVAECQAPSSLGEPYRSCYAIGMRGDGDACLSAHDDCIQACDNPPASAGAGGEGGHGDAGAPGASGTPGSGGAPATGGTGTATGGAADTGGAAETGGAGHTGN